MNSTNNRTFTFFQRTTAAELIRAMSSVPANAGVVIRTEEHRDPREPQGTFVTITVSWKEEGND